MIDVVGKPATAELVKETRNILPGMEKNPEAKPALDALGADRFIPSPAKEYGTLAKAVVSPGKK